MPSEALARQVQAFLATHLPAPDASSASRLTVAFSGGLDSTVLLHVLAGLRFTEPFHLRAAHVHHGLSAHADLWAQHCRQTCLELGIEFDLIRVALDCTDGRGIEAAAREARHAALAALPSDWIVLGHHANDQAETLLHRLVRGTGVLGAAAMRPLDPVSRRMRPLLDVPRAALQGYAETHRLAWVEDDSNPDTRFTRNFLRHNILAPLSVRFPAVTRQFAGAARRFADASELLDELANQDLAALDLLAPGVRARFRALSPNRRRNVLRYWLRRLGCQTPEEVHLDAGLMQLCGSAAVRLPFGEVALCAYRDALWAEARQPGELQSTVWRGEAYVPWGAGGVISKDSTTADAGISILHVSPELLPLCLDCARGDDSLQLARNRPRRGLRHLCQDAGIPPWWRLRLPVLRAGTQSVWIGGIGIDAKAQAQLGEPGQCVCWLPAQLPGGGSPFGFSAGSCK